jgi:DNA-binding transcriptional LysR family regulator
MDRSERIERRLKLHDLRVLMAVVEQGSMGKAAEQLETSQPAISRAIGDLELFSRRAASRSWLAGHRTDAAWPSPHQT